ncbi:MAG: Asp-tRNA(Asn)/Glu-tRNA(Gln) amidotransferase subunit GatC [Candidatus Aenigmatarchaeota archaeon]
MKEEVEKVASLASIELTEEEKEDLGKDMESILDWFSRLDEIDTEDAKPAFHPIELKNEMREDEVEEGLNEEEVFQNTENEEDGFFKGPSIR